MKFRKNGNTEPGRRRGPRQRHTGQPAAPACPAACLVAKQKSLSKSAISSPAMPRHTQLGDDQSEASISRGDPEPGPMRGRACGHLLSPSSASRLSRPTAGFLPPTPSSLSAVENLPGWCCERELSISLKVFIAYLLRSNLLFARLNDGITSSLSKLTYKIFVVYFTPHLLLPG